MTKRTITFQIYQGTNFTVEVVGWVLRDEWHWNVYLYLMPEHPRYSDDLQDLPFHCGITFDEIQTSLAFDPKYDFQTEKKWRKTGSDYMHLGDNFTEYSADEGIPAQVENDANALVVAIKV